MSLRWFVGKSSSYSKDGFENQGRDRFSVCMPLLIEECLVENWYVWMDIHEIGVEVR